jgi:hypothetical protein
MNDTSRPFQAATDVKVGRCGSDESMHQREVYKTCCYGFWQNGVGQQPQTNLNEVLGNLGRLGWRSVFSRSLAAGIWAGHGDGFGIPPSSTQIVHSTGYSLLLLCRVTLLHYQDLRRFQPHLVTDTDQASLVRLVAT